MDAALDLRWLTDGVRPSSVAVVEEGDRASVREGREVLGDGDAVEKEYDIPARSHFADEQPQAIMRCDVALADRHTVVSLQAAHGCRQQTSSDLFELETRRTERAAGYAAFKRLRMVRRV